MRSVLKTGEELRLSDFKIPNMTVFDSETVFLNLSNDKSIPKHKQADLIIKNPDYAEHMRDLFLGYWEKSITLDDFKRKTK